MLFGKFTGKGFIVYRPAEGAGSLAAWQAGAFGWAVNE
jgi:hypothetical protein